MNNDFYYAILGLDQDASIEDAKQAYKSMVKSWHPDQFVNDPDLKKNAEEKLKDINIAYHAIQQAINARKSEISSNLNGGHFQSEFLPFREKRQPGHFIKHLFSFLINVLDRIFASREMGKKARLSTGPGKKRSCNTRQNSGHRDSMRQFDDRGFREILKGKLQSGTGRYGELRSGQPNFQTGRPPGMRSLRKHRYVRTRTGIVDSEPVSPVSPVGRVKGIGKYR
ncbi:MAG: DnaJ domain-containing protein [Desulfobacterales bacterium]|nr:DnaJ domain-containing protein [Desulfobacterales bacterium]MDD4071738.1 DnaJ domain-containing protein [Desulfobacterales bacterium]MDD4391699.1 DnaJ domain-containing protein [Desulfobacterales bacterium]